MRTLVAILATIFGLMLLYAIAWIAWQQLTYEDVEQMKATVEHHHDVLKESNQKATLKVEKVRASGFPFAVRVALIHPSIAMIAGDETYVVSFSKLEWSKVNDTTYRLVNLPKELEALYAKSGAAPEKYKVTWNETPEIYLQAVDEKSPLTKFGVKLPRQLTLTAELNGRTRQIGFNNPILLPQPIYQEIPADASRPLALFVGMLREALVYSK